MQWVSDINIPDVVAVSYCKQVTSNYMFDTPKNYLTRHSAVKGISITYDIKRHPT